MGHTSYVARQCTGETFLNQCSMTINGRSLTLRGDHNVQRPEGCLRVAVRLRGRVPRVCLLVVGGAAQPGNLTVRAEGRATRKIT